MNTTDQAFLKSSVALLAGFSDAQHAEIADIITTSKHYYGLESPKVTEEIPADG